MQEAVLVQAAGDKVQAHVAAFYLRCVRQTVHVRESDHQGAHLGGGAITRQQWEVMHLMSGQLHAKSIGSPVSSDTAAACLAALHLGHALWAALVLAHAHARVRLITVYRIVFASFSGDRMGARQVFGEFLRTLGGSGFGATCR